MRGVAGTWLWFVMCFFCKMVVAVGGFGEGLLIGSLTCWQSRMRKQWVKPAGEEINIHTWYDACIDNWR